MPFMLSDYISSSFFHEEEIILCEIILLILVTFIGIGICLKDLLHFSFGKRKKHVHANENSSKRINETEVEEDDEPPGNFFCQCFLKFSVTLNSLQKNLKLMTGSHDQREYLKMNRFLMEKSYWTDMKKVNNILFFFLIFVYFVQDDPDDSNRLVDGATNEEQEEVSDNKEEKEQENAEDATSPILHDEDVSIHSSFPFSSTSSILMNNGNNNNNNTFKKKPYLFISYDDQDETAFNKAKQLSKFLSKQGIKSWYQGKDDYNFYDTNDHHTTPGTSINNSHDQQQQEQEEELTQTTQTSSQQQREKHSENPEINEMKKEGIPTSNRSYTSSIRDNEDNSILEEFINDKLQGIDMIILLITSKYQDRVNSSNVFDICRFQFIQFFKLTTNKPIIPIVLHSNMIETRKHWYNRFGAYLDDYTILDFSSNSLFSENMITIHKKKWKFLLDLLCCMMKELTKENENSGVGVAAVVIEKKKEVVDGGTPNPQEKRRNSGQQQTNKNLLTKSIQYLLSSPPIDSSNGEKNEANEQSSLISCSKHPEKPYLYYDMDCSCFFCEDCYREEGYNHENHNIVDETSFQEYYASSVDNTLIEPTPVMKQEIQRSLATISSLENTSCNYVLYVVQQKETMKKKIQKDFQDVSHTSAFFLSGFLLFCFSSVLCCLSLLCLFLFPFPSSSRLSIC
jgi:hypothetical protein